ncbi:hypothetical protein BANRA_02604 [Acinetobacter baumannii]|nr:hypothetical protein AMPH_81140 [Acinetobacter baumannii]CVI03225.1 hypothetical protein AMPH_92089 [Acinetobacter baumannii]CVI04524.1 hypothetical protein AMPH_12672 [Acinetobacter baumannii]CVI05155.1 hypothetical protein AMPH_63374 [Acinetobacter baumannii]CVI11442.1 hypothetical protein AMPH_23661 [Acinetobacter baumannii]
MILLMPLPVLNSDFSEVTAEAAAAALVTAVLAVCCAVAAALIASAVLPSFVVKRESSEVIFDALALVFVALVLICVCKLDKVPLVLDL